MDITQKIEKNIGTVYHEIGHLFAYVISAQSIETTLGSVLSFETGLIKNSVTPSESLYHCSSILKKREKEKIIDSTKSLKRTIAWFIEVVSGCTFQCIKENKPFNLCFGYEVGKLGQLDFNNLNVIRNISSFIWTFDDIHSIQEDYSQIIRKHGLIEVLQPTVSDIKLKLLTSPHQIKLTNDKLEEICFIISKLISKNLLNDYHDLVDKYYKKFNVSS